MKLWHLQIYKLLNKIVNELAGILSCTFEGLLHLEGNLIGNVWRRIKQTSIHQF